MNPENAFAKRNHLFVIKILRKLGTEENFLFPMKGIYKNLTANLTFKCGMLKAFLLV